MKRWAAVAAVAALFGVIPPAHADENTFYSDIAQKVDTPLTNTQSMYLGMLACNAIRDGISAGLSPAQALAKADSAVDWAQNDMGLGLNQDEGKSVVQVADDHLC